MLRLLLSVLTILSFVSGAAAASIGNLLAGQGHAVKVVNIDYAVEYCGLAGGVGTPGGMSLWTTCVLQGTPWATGPFSFTVLVIDRATGGMRGEVITGNVVDPVTITTAVLPHPVFNVWYSQTLAAFGGGAGPINFSAVSGLPPGMHLLPSGILDGVPSTTGIYTLVVNATDADTGSVGIRTYTLNIVRAPRINAFPLATPVLGAPYSQSLNVSDGLAPVTCGMSMGALPAGLTVDSNSCAISGAPTASGVFHFVVSATDSNGTSGDRPYSMTIAAAPTITTASLPVPIITRAYSQTIVKTGGTAPVTCSISAGALPSGLALSSTCTLSGTPTVAGAYSFTVTATDVNGLTGSQTYAGAIAAPVAIATASLPVPAVTLAYAQTVVTTGGTAPLGFTVTAGSLPAGLALDAATGAITGAATTPGPYSFTINVVDVNGFSDAKAYSGTIAAAPTLTTAVLPVPVFSKPYSQTLATSGGTAPIAFAVTGGALPGGLSLNAASGVISGTPNVAGAYSFTVTATDANGLADAKTYAGTIAAQVAVTTAVLPVPVFSQPYSQTLATSGGTAPIAFAVTGGALPGGLSLNAASGVVSGTSNAAGAYSFTVTATDVNGLVDAKTYAGTIAAQVAITTAVLPVPVFSKPYSQTLATTGGTAPVSFAVTGGALPGGLSLNAGSGVISGTSNAAGAYSFTVTATDANGLLDAKTYAGTISAQVAITTAVLPVPVFSRPYSQTLATSGGTAPIAFALTGGALPGGLSLDAATGAITGTSNAAGAYSFTVTATDANGLTDAKTYAGTIFDRVTITTAVLPVPVFSKPYSQSLATAGGAAPVVFAVTGGALPGGLALNAATGVISGTTNAAGAYSFTVTAIDANGLSHAVTYTGTIAVQVAITTAVLPVPVFSKPYSQSLATSGGTAPVTFAVTGGALPAGLALNAATGAITGTSNAAGVYSFTVTVTDANGLVDAKTYAGTIAAQVAITTDVLPVPVFSKPYSQTLATSSGTAPVTFAVTGGALPGGLALNAATGSITGTSNAAGAYSFTVTATDANGLTHARTYAGVIAAALAVTTVALPAPTAGEAYSQRMATSGGTAPFGFALTGGSLPAGLSLDAATGLIAGTPTSAGVYSFTITATDANGLVASRTYAGRVAGVVAILTLSLPDPSVGMAYSQTIVVEGGTQPLACAVSAGALPAGLALNAATCTVAGTATTPGAYSFTIMARDANGSSAVQTYAGMVRAAASVSLTASAASVTLSRPVTFTARVAGASPTGTVSFHDGGVLLGAGTVAGGVATLTVSNLTLGAHTIVARYAGDANNLPAVSNALALAVSRPDPSQDPSVRGIVSAQAGTALRFAATQMSNMQQRLETMHGESDGDCADAAPGGDVCVNFANGIRPTAGPRAQSQENLETLREASLPPAMRSSQTLAAQAQAQANQAAFGALGDFDKPDANGRRTFVSALTNGAAPSNGVETVAQAPAPATKLPSISGKARFTPWTFNVWTAGSVATGRTAADGRSVEDKFTTSGLTFGVDTRIMPGLKAGLSLGFARDKTDIGTDGTVVKGTSVSGAAYATWRVFGNVFVDGLVGYGHATFKSSRWSAPYGEWYEGERKAKTLFESIALTSEYRTGQLLIAPYIRADFIQVQLDRYSETGGAGALSFDKSRVNSVDAVLGLRGRYDFVTSWGTVGPTARIELHRLLTGAFTQTLAYTVDPGLLYAIMDNGQTRWGASGALGLQATGKGGPLGSLSGGLEFMFSTTGSQMNARGLRANIKASF